MYIRINSIVKGPSSRNSFYEPEETVIFYGFIILQENFDGLINALYREFVDSEFDPLPMVWPPSMYLMRSEISAESPPLDFIP